MTTRKEMMLEDELYSALGAHCEVCCDLVKEIIKLRSAKFVIEVSTDDWRERFFEVSTILELPGYFSVPDTLDKLQMVYDQWKEMNEIREGDK
jgi:hypothetical protein